MYKVCNKTVVELNVYSLIVNFMKWFLTGFLIIHNVWSIENYIWKCEALKLNLSFTLGAKNTVLLAYGCHWQFINCSLCSFIWLVTDCHIIAGITNDEQCASCVSRLVQELPERHKSTLHFLMMHFCQICQLQYARGMTELPTRIIDFLCYAILRPPWDKAV